MANAVMRRLADEAADFPWGDARTDRDALARQHAHPRWIVDAVIDSLGERNGLDMLACGLEPAPTYVRLNPFAHDRNAVLDSLEGAGPEPTPPDPDCFRLTVPSVAFGTGHDETAWFAMDAAAQMAPLVCAPGLGTRVLDVGAGRGNKTICLQSIAVRSGGQAEITAIDVHAGKSETLRARLDAANVPGVVVITADAAALYAQFGPDSFDTVLLDAPCTGLGTLRRYPEKRWRLDPGDSARMAEMQARLLDAAAAVTCPGGRVVYSTCSVDRRENDGVVAAFLASDSGKGWVVEKPEGVIPADWAAFRDERGCFQSWPTSGGPDGHYVASLRRADV
jgi:16S rRNA (cytosine967-C5)-methyltransferase